MRFMWPVVLAFGGTMPCYAADWPQWLGPQRDGGTSEKVSAWKQQPTIIWRQTVGEGYSAPIVAEGRVFVHARVADRDEEEVVAFAADSGKPIWRQSYVRNAVDTDCGGYGPRATPAVSEGRLFTFGISGVLSCWSVADGALVWQIDTHKQFKAPRLRFGVSSSLLVVGQQVIAQVGGKDAAVVALDASTGKVRWQTRNDGPGYASPILFGAGPARHVVVLTPESLLGLRLDDGQVLWDHPNDDLLKMPAVTPVVSGPLILTTHTLMGQAMRIEEQSAQWRATPAWKATTLASYIATPIAVRDRLIVVGNSFLPTQSANLRCVDAATGKELWRKDRIGKHYAGLIRTGDDRLLMLDETGMLVLLDPLTDVYRELSRSKVSGATMALPALANGRLFVRDHDTLQCLRIEP